MRNLTALSLALLTATGCIVHTSDRDYEPDVIEVEVPTVTNYAPDVLWADAGCFYDGYERSDIWYFEADVDDFDGPFDVVSVWADVYDEWDGSWIDWLAYSTHLSCFYPDYTVDIVAYDAYEAYDYMTIWADTY